MPKRSRKQLKNLRKITNSGINRLNCLKFHLSIRKKIEPFNVIDKHKYKQLIQGDSKHDIRGTCLVKN